MHTTNTLITAVTHQVYGTARQLCRLGPASAAVETDGEAGRVRDRGALSLEQVLWFVAAGVSVAGIATILWTQIKDNAEDPTNIQRPAAP